MVDTTKPTLSAFQLTVIVVVVVFSLNFGGAFQIFRVKLPLNRCMPYILAQGRA